MATTVTTTASALQASSCAIAAVFIDLSGTLHINDTPLPGCTSALKRLRRECPDLIIKFVTNTTIESKTSLHRKLIDLGFEIQLNELFTSLSAAHRFISRKNLKPLLFLEDAAVEEFALEYPDDVEKDYNAVVIGFAPSQFHYKKLNQAFHLLSRHPKAPIIAVHKSPIYLDQSVNDHATTTTSSTSSSQPSTPSPKTNISLGPGPFISLLETAAAKEAIVVGKPSSSFFKEAITHTFGGLSLSGGASGAMKKNVGQVWMIGDDIVADVSGMKSVGGHAILVKSGKYKQGDETKLKDKSLRPDAVLNSFVEAVDLLIELRQK